MQPDPEYLRQHYALLSDEALLEIDRADLVEVAQACYDHEIARRGLIPAENDLQDDGPSSSRDEDPELAYERTSTEDRPDWLEDAVTAVAYRADPRGGEATVAADAQDVLRAAGIPCYLDLHELPQEETPAPEPTHEWRVMVPSKFTFHATSVLKKEIYNADFESNWKAHLEALSDEELGEMSPREVFCGLFDQIERVNRVYNAELAHRRRGT